MLRPHLIDLLFLRSLPDPFERVKKNKKKKKNSQKNCMKCKYFRKIVFFFKNCFPDIFWFLLLKNMNIQDDPRNNKSHECGLIDDVAVESMKVWVPSYFTQNCYLAAYMCDIQNSCGGARWVINWVELEMCH